jgi:hypothetical protein
MKNNKEDQNTIPLAYLSSLAFSAGLINFQSSQKTKGKERIKPIIKETEKLIIN